MKKWLFLLVAMFALAACSNEGEEKPKEDAQTEVENGEEAKEHADHVHAEPDEHTECAYCNMKVYMENEEMGEFSAQATTADGEVLFFDDAGCLVNFENDNEDVKLTERLVRDFDTKEWVALEDAHIAHADIATPMKYGNAFFNNEEGLNKFLESATDAKKSSVDEIKEVAFARAAKKKEMGGGHDHGDHGDQEMDHDDHDMEDKDEHKNH